MLRLVRFGFPREFLRTTKISFEVELMIMLKPVAGHPRAVAAISETSCLASVAAEGFDTSCGGLLRIGQPSS
jgi:hypothetical protein